MDYKLSILIPSLQSRAEKFLQLYDVLRPQLVDGVQMLTEIDNGELSIGSKRNLLLDKAKGEYIAFIDDDDTVSKDYVKHLMEGINKGVDCVSLRGVITWDGDRPELFEHSIKYDAYRTNDTGVPKYERYPNHLNCIKASIAKKFKFPEISHGEDTDFATQIFKSGLIKTEHYVDSVLYHYNFVTNK